MRITSIAYSEYESAPSFWEVDQIPFDAVNLIVGRNAVGKTRLLNVIKGLAELVSGRRSPLETGRYFAEFTSGEMDYKYEIAFKDSDVVFERLRERPGRGRFRDLLRRSEGGYGKIRIKTGKSSKLIDFECPVGQVGVFSRQDRVNHPFLVDFVEWGSSTYHFLFGRGEIKEFLILDSEGQGKYDPLDTSKFSGTFKEGMEKFGEKFSEALINDLERVGYDVDEIEISKPFGVTIQQPVPGRIGVVSVKESDIECFVGSHHLSAGMLRVLSLIIQINYRVMAHDPSLFIVDDIGEGLDFERTCSLIELLIEKAKDSDIQLIMSSNDRFVMNNVPLNYWILLNRTGSSVKAITQSTHPKEFEEFRYTGLSNFDFFAQHYAKKRS